MCDNASKENFHSIKILLNLHEHFPMLFLNYFRQSALLIYFMHVVLVCNYIHIWLTFLYPFCGIHSEASKLWFVSLRTLFLSISQPDKKWFLSRYYTIYVVVFYDILCTSGANIKKQKIYSFSELKLNFEEKTIVLKSIFSKNWKNLSKTLQCYHTQKT